jgi:hypothetical protein
MQVYLLLLLLLLLLLTSIEVSLGGSSPYTSTDKTNKNIHKQNTVLTIQNTVNTSTHITKHSHKVQPTHTNTHTLHNQLKQSQYKIQTK